MASAQKTSKGFNKWAANDRPTRSDFNSDNEKVTALLEELDGKLAELDSQLENKANMGRSFIRLDLSGGDGVVGTPDMPPTAYVSDTGLVEITGSVRRQDGGLFNAWTGICHIPVGFRPPHDITFPVMVGNNAGRRTVMGCAIKADTGGFVFMPNNSGEEQYAHNLDFHVTYYAAQ